MIAQYQEPFVDRSTSCTTDFAVALMLGRRNFDGAYPTYKVEEDPINPMGYEVAHDRFLDFLDTSVFEILEGEQLDIEMKKQLAIEAKADIKADGQGDKEQRISPLQKTIDECRQQLVENEKAVSLARKYLRDIDDELADKVNSALREDTTATQKNGGVIYITLASLDRWFDTALPKGFRRTLKYGAASNVKAMAEAKPAADTEVAHLAKVAAEAEEHYDIKDDQCNGKGQMNKKGRESLYLTVGILINLYFDLAKEASILVDSLPKNPLTKIDNLYVEAYPHIKNAGAIIKKGSLTNSKLAFLIQKTAKEYSDRNTVSGQRTEVILNRIEEALETKERKLGHITPIDTAPEIT
jgi:hypothetical protein